MDFMVGYYNKGLDLMAQELPCEAAEGARSRENKSL